MKTLNRRISSALIGVTLLVVTAFEAYLQSFGFYREHYVVPEQKYGVLTSLRWQDIAFLAIFWPIAIAAFYFSYRLLRYAIQSRSPNSDEWAGGPGLNVPKRAGGAQVKR